MNIKQFIDSLNFDDQDFKIEGNALHHFKTELLSLDEFSELDNLILINLPAFLDADNKARVVSTLRLSPNYKFKGTLYLYGFSLTPGVVKENTPKIVKDGAGVSPTVYDSKDFYPRNYIYLEYKKEEHQDMDVIHENMVYLKGGTKSYRERLHETLDKVLDNMNEYRIKGERDIILSGVWSEYGLSKK